MAMGPPHRAAARGPRPMTPPSALPGRGLPSARDDIDGLADPTGKGSDMGKPDYTEVVLGYLSEDAYHDIQEQNCGNCPHFYRLRRELDSEIGTCDLLEPEDGEPVEVVADWWCKDHG